MKKLLLLPLASTLLLSSCILTFNEGDDPVSSNKQPISNTINIASSEDITDTTDSTFTTVESNLVCENQAPVTMEIENTYSYTVESGKLFLYDAEDCYKEIYSGNNSTLVGTWGFTTEYSKNTSAHQECDPTLANMLDNHVQEVDGSLVISDNQISSNANVTFKCFAEFINDINQHEFDVDEDAYEAFPHFQAQVIDCHTIEFNYGFGLIEKYSFAFENNDVDVIFTTTYKESKCEYKKEGIYNNTLNENNVCTETKRAEIHNSCHNNLVAKAASESSSLNKIASSSITNRIQNTIKSIITKTIK